MEQLRAATLNRAIGLSNIEFVYGTIARDVLIGDNGNNTINGLVGPDKLYGNGGNDTIGMVG